ncbi:putative hydrolase/esterase/lipase [Nocardia neocaledoniensis NBRC 108232]|uniref:Acetyl esterase/lipase n=1 Tax=Nocardia neocaledoniensis TaxID=236511 RepID=A0A317NBP4_9NOCA|nr:alpha/beta hydrolase [Nocardia neocaledoniensis]PWV71038.1 acetyl esterase/lipase [Nocardia neocaledoniensis]GEM30296.1 putative hydrolase/esterase/lipase [Nocardia neocaledoniensis NBRC 108232]
MISSSDRDPVDRPFLLRTDFPGGSLRSRAVSRTLRCTVKPIIALVMRMPDRRWPFHLVDWLGRPLTSARGVTRAAVALPNCAAILTKPVEIRDERYIVYLHGGAFLVGGNHLHRQLTARIAADFGAEVLAVTYRKMPAHSVAVSIADSIEGYRYALDQGARPENITIMGDSAGGYLALMTAIELRRQGLPQPAAVVAMSPLTDWDLPPRPTSACAVFPREMRSAFRDFAVNAGQGTVPESPARCDLTGLPPVLIQASTTETVCPDAELMAERLADHGVSCELQLWADEVHVFQAAASVTPEAASAVAEIGRFLDRTVGAKAIDRTA